MSQLEPKYRSLAAACLAIFMPGALAFGFPGVMASHWQAAFGASRADIGQIIFFMLAGVALITYLAGRWQESWGPGRVVVLGSLLGAAANLLLIWAQGMAEVYLWAMANGMYGGCVIIPALSVVQRWFAANKGLAAGLVSMVFGLGGALTAPLFTWALAAMGPRWMCLALALVVLLAGLLLAPLLRFPASPPPAPGPAGAAPRAGVGRALTSLSFWALWLTWALGGAAGIAMVTLSTTFGLARGLDLPTAVIILTCFNLTNGFSRLLSGWVSDHIGRNITMAATFLAAGAAFFLLNQFSGLAAWAGLAAVIGFAFGTLFSVSVPLTADCFGLEHFGAVFGLVFTAYGFVAGALGPWLAGHLLDLSGGDFGLVFGYLGGFMLASAGLIMLVRPLKTAG
ncbi:MAG: MFS transporter [Desulfarculaceae bacterium]|nr:MFS transporter [Desulfarculaceae bacterium]MCF8072001.1 MFS transporter [Desulfarculaceae bacterium]MCF8101518.1 MFS transporter [Desulfarculaceae bacterium]MCF8115068.1 MFS transporter [Desulfarculaceae bacterium]